MRISPVAELQDRDGFPVHNFPFTMLNAAYVMCCRPIASDVLNDFVGSAHAKIGGDVC